MSTEPLAPSPAQVDGIGAPCDTDDPRIRTFGLLLEAHQQVTRALDLALQDSDGITLQTFEVLLRISRSPQGMLTMSELAGEVALSTGGVTRLADRLADDGLVERRACPSDRRRVHLALTDTGRDVLVRAMEHHLVALDEHLASRIDPADLPSLERALDTLRRPA
jgi:DNA-binding MarR family transcriptional regulator